MGICLVDFRGGSCVDPVWVSAVAEGEEYVPPQQLQYYFLLDLEGQNIKGDWLDHHFRQRYRHM